MVDSVTAALPNIQARRAVPLAVTSAQRSSLLPDVPTVRESGLPALARLRGRGLARPDGAQGDAARSGAAFEPRGDRSVARRGTVALHSRAWIGAFRLPRELSSIVS